MIVSDQSSLHSSAIKWLIATLIFMGVGTITELLLLAHYEDNWQITPIGIIALSLISFLIWRYQKSSSLLFVVKLLLIASILSGILGTWFHLKANMEFAQELNPGLKGMSLLLKSLKGAFPALAPGSMIIFGLIGFITTTLTLKQSQ